MRQWLWRRLGIGWEVAGGICWFRVFGVGLQALHRRHAPLFSERNGYRRFWPKYPTTAWRVGLLGRR